MPDIPIKFAILLGGNLGDVAGAFREAARQLAAGGAESLRMSALRRTAPVDCAPGTPDFQNAALTGRWRGSPLELLRLMQRIEVSAGRPADHGYHQSRTLDLDLILFGDRIIELPELTVPHPRARRRRFVLEPLAEIAPDWCFPEDGMTVKAALRELSGLTD